MTEYKLSERLPRKGQRIIVYGVPDDRLVVLPSGGRAAIYAGVNNRCVALRSTVGRAGLAFVPDRDAVTWRAA